MRSGGRSPIGRTATLVIAFLVVALIAEFGVIVFLVNAQATGTPASSTTKASGLGSWAATGSMRVARSYSAVATLQDGRVLVAGGFAGAVKPAILSSTEIYNPENGSWSASADMRSPRAGFVAALLGNGNVLVAGGEAAAGNVTNTAEVYDPSSGSWTLTGSMTFPRLDHQAVSLDDGRVFVVGGTLASGSSPAEIFDPRTGTWTLTPPQLFPRTDEIAVKLSDGRVLVAGGQDGKAPTGLSEIYDPSTNAWTVTGSLNDPRSDGAGVLLKNGDVLFAGGYVLYNGSFSSINDLYTSELYNSTTGTWTMTGDMALPRGETGMAAVLLSSGQVLVPGGNYQPETGQSSAELYNPSTRTWASAGSMSVPRGSGEMAILLTNGRALVFGGLLPHSCAYCGANTLPGPNLATSSADIFTPG
jgi:N-acetylneuraminic acid mutarotase